MKKSKFNLQKTSTNNSLNKCAAFTLAEVLITLAIIGIVAALTIPALISNYQKKTYVAQLQKVYSSLSNAAKMLMADEMVDNLSDTYLFYEGDEDYENSVGRFLKTYFKVVKTCNKLDDTLRECIPNDYKTLKGKDANYLGFGYCGVLAGGEIICMSTFAAFKASSIAIDVNGNAGPNVWGRDAFSLSMNSRGEIAESCEGGITNTDNFHNNPYYCQDDEVMDIGYGIGCFSKIFREGWKMDY